LAETYVTIYIIDIIEFFIHANYPFGAGVHARRKVDPP
jgi:hypothetical protein